MTHLRRTLLSAGFLLVVFVPANPIRADGPACGDGCCAGGCPCAGRYGSHPPFQPNVTFYITVPYWFPNYFAFGPYPYTDYQYVHYWTPPAESARIVREHLNAMAVMYAAMGAPQGQPVPPPTGKEPLPPPKPPAKEPLPPPKPTPPDKKPL